MTFTPHLDMPDRPADPPPDVVTWRCWWCSQCWPVPDDPNTIDGVRSAAIAITLIAEHVKTAHDRSFAEWVRATGVI